MKKLFALMLVLSLLVSIVCMQNVYASAAYTTVWEPDLESLASATDAYTLDSVNPSAVSYTDGFVYSISPGSSLNVLMNFNQELAVTAGKKSVIQFSITESARQVVAKPYIIVGDTQYQLSNAMTNNSDTTLSYTYTIVADWGTTGSTYFNGDLTTTAFSNSLPTNPGTFKLGFLINRNSTNAAAIRNITIKNLKIWETDANLDYTIGDVTNTSATVNFNMPLLKEPIVAVDGENVSATKVDDCTYTVAYAEKSDDASCTVSVTAAAAIGTLTAIEKSFTTPKAPFMTYSWYENGTSESADNLYTIDDTKSAYARADGTLNVSHPFDTKSEDTITLSGIQPPVGDKLVVEYVYSLEGGGDATVRQQRLYIGNTNGGRFYIKPYQRKSDYVRNKYKITIILDFSNQTYKVYENDVEITESTPDLIIDAWNTAVTKSKTLDFMFASQTGTSIADSKKYCAYDYIAIYEPASTLKYEVVNGDASFVDGVSVKFNQPVNITAPLNSEIDKDKDCVSCYKLCFDGEKHFGTAWSDFSFSANAQLDSALTASDTISGTVLTATINKGSVAVSEGSTEETKIATADFNVVTNGTLPVSLIIAGYNEDGSLEDVNIQTVKAVAGKTAYSAQTELKNASNYKMFIWSAKGNLIPYAE